MGQPIALALTTAPGRLKQVYLVLSMKTPRRVHAARGFHAEHQVDLL